MTSGPRRRGEWTWLVIALLAVDILTISVAFFLAYLVRFDLGWFALEEQRAQPQMYVLIGAVAMPLWLAAFAACGLYRRELLLGGPQEYGRLAHACTYGFGAVAVLSFLTANATHAVSRGWLVACWPLALALTALGRFNVRRVAYRLRRRGLFVTDTVIIGVNAQSVAIAREIDRPVDSGARVVGFLDDFLPRGATVDGRWQVLGPPSTLGETDAAEAIVVQRALTWESLYDLLRGMASGVSGPHLRLAPTFFDLLTTGIRVSQRGSVPVIALNQSRIAGLDAVLKCGFEFATALAMIVLLAPVIVARLLVCRMRHEPMLERCVYRGSRGKPVEIVTFVHAAAESDRLRRLIEKSPALLSVLRGDVALVGPRLTRWAPGATADVRLALHSVRPGLTGPVSVAGVSLQEDTALALELSYIRNYSIWRDLHIVWQRMLLVLRGGRAQMSPPSIEARTRALVSSGE